jgi:hypothetical protein
MRKCAGPGLNSEFLAVSPTTSLTAPSNLYQENFINLVLLTNILLLLSYSGELAFYSPLTNGSFASTVQ